MRPFALCTSLVLLLAPLSSAQDKKPITVEDLYRIESRGAFLNVPKSNKAYFSRTWIDAKTKQERNALGIIVDPPKGKAGPAEPDEADADARSPMLSPDGEWVVFLSTRPRPKDWKQTPPVPRYSDAAVDIWLLPTKGGKAIPLAGPDKPYGRVFHDGFYGRVAFSPEGKRLVFVADDGKDPRTPEEIANDVRIVRPDQGEGYTGYGPAQIWIAHLVSNPGGFAAKKIDRLTKDDVWYGDPQWSPDGANIAVHANKSDDRESVRFSINKNFDIYTINVGTGKQRQVTDGPGPEVSPRFSPDGKRIACLSVPRKGPHRELFNLMIITATPEGPKVKVVVNSREGDKPPPPPSFPLSAKCWDDDDTLIYSSEHGVADDLVRLKLASEKIDVKSVTPTVALPAQLVKDRVLAETRVYTWKNDEWLLESVLTIPPPEVAKAPYKLLVYPHGGPHGRVRMGFDFTAQLFAAHGYLVFQPNFRGSTGYGQKFVDADRFDLGGGDMRDILTGIDALIKDGLVQKDQQYVYGISYGGFMTSWLVGQTTQFRAACAQNAVTDHNMMWALSDLQSWTQWELGGLPWEQPERYKKMSPLTYADKVKTPTLILHSANDRRCPLPMGKAYHQALLAAGVPTQMVIYPDENHGIRQPRHREDVYRRVLAWFEKHGK